MNFMKEEEGEGKKDSFGSFRTGANDSSRGYGSAANFLPGL